MPVASRSCALAGASLALTLLAACAPGGERSSDSATPEGATAAARADTTPLVFTAIGEVATRELDESSGLAASRRTPGYFWTMNDDTDALLFAITATGVERGRLRLRMARNVDWEAVAIGPCAGDVCLYIGDTGDNDARRPTRTIYRVPEPALEREGTHEARRAEELTYTYPDGPKDVEAMYVSGDGAVWLISKRPLRDSTGRQRRALVYRLADSTWTVKGRTPVAELVDSLEIVPGSAPSRLITDASLSPDGRTLAVRTYGELYLLDADPATGRPSGGAPRRVCDLSAVAERQGEGIAWESADGTFLLSSEGGDVPKMRSTLARAQCRVAR